MAIVYQGKPICTDCPSYLSPDQVPGWFKKSTGSAMCGRYGYVLDKPSFEPRQTAKLQQYLASKCDSFGEPRPGAPLKYDLYVAMPDAETIGREPDEVKQKACTTCGMCRNFVRDDVVARELGWATGMCAAQGKLILPTRQVYEARDCSYREAGLVRTSLHNITLLPEYDDDFGSLDPIKEFFLKRESAVDPSEYLTDREVTETENEAGIRAWRRVTDEGEEHEAFLPIYRPDFFTGDEWELVPKTGSDEHPELYVDHFNGVYTVAVCWSELDETPALNGQAGTGKTELFRHIAWLMQLPFRRISITASTELDDVAGKMHYSPDRGTYFQYGRLPAAWKKPGVICIDEPNVGPPDVWQFLRPLTDNSKQLVLDQNNGELIRRHNDCYMGMAMNPSWDVKNVGAMQISDADANRLFHLAVPLPPPLLEREIIRQRVKLDGWEIDDTRLNMVMRIAEDIRALINEDGLSISWAIRPQIKVARALRWFDPITAYRRAVADFLEPEQADVLLTAVRSVVPFT